MDNYCKIVFIRHGVTDWNQQRRYMGRTDVPMNVRGHQETINLANQLAGSSFDAIYASPTSRTWRTAELIRERLHNRCPIVPNDQLREIDFGWIEGMTYEQALLCYPTELSHWYSHYETVPPPGGTESMKHVRKRMLHFMKCLSESHLNRVLVVSHGGPIRAWLSYWNRQPFWAVSVNHNEWHECILSGRSFEFESC